MAGIRFVIPIKPDNLLVESTRAAHSNVYTVKSLDQTPQEISGTLKDIERSFPQAIEDPSQFVWDNFDVFFMSLRKFDNLEQSARKGLRDILIKTLTKYIRWLDVIFPQGAADNHHHDHSQTLNSSQGSVSQDTMTKSRGTASLTPQEKLMYCNTTKMLVWLISQLVELFEDQAQSSKWLAKAGIDQGSDSGKARSGKGSSKAREEFQNWDLDKERIAERLVMLYTQYPINRLFTPTILEDEFVQLLTKTAYKMLESHETIKSRPHLKDHIFTILGTAVVKNKQGLSLCVRMIQLLQRNEKLADILSQLVSSIVENHQEKGMVRDLIHEIDRIDVKELSRDSSGPRAIGEFMCHLSERLAGYFVNHVHLMYPFLEQDSYQLRNATLTVFGNVVLKLRELGGESPESHNKAIRDQLLDKLEDHIHDVTGYVRSHTLQVWLKLCLTLDAVPRSRFQSLVELTVGRLNDKVCQVRKSAVQLLNTILKNSPYGNNISLVYLKNLRKETKDKLDQMMKETEAINKAISQESEEGSSQNTAVDDGEAPAEDEPVEGGSQDKSTESESTLGNESENGSQNQNGSQNTSSQPTTSTQPENNNKADERIQDLPELHKLQMLDMHFQEAVHFAEMLTNAMPSVANLLNATNLTDTQEAIKFFVTAHQFHLDGTAKCIRKIISLIWSSEEKVRTEAYNAYKDIYFSNQDGASGKEHARVVVESLMELISSATIGDMASVEEFVRRLVESGDVSKDVKDITWQVYTMKRPGTTIEGCRAAASLISMYGTADWKFISDNMDILIKYGLSPVESLGNKYDSRLVRETCSAMIKVAPVHFKADDKYPPYRKPMTDQLFTTITDIILDRIQDLEDQYFYSMTGEIFKVIFRLAEHPDLLCGQIIRKTLSEIVTKAKENTDSTNAATQSTQQSTQQNTLLKPPTPVEGSSQVSSSQTSSQATGSICSEDTHTTKSSLQSGTEKLIPPGSNPYIDGEIFTRFIVMLGDIALSMLIHVEYNIAIELKIRNQLKEEKENRKGSKYGKTPGKTPSSSRRSRLGPNDSVAMEEEMMGGASAVSVEDTQMDQLQRICREEIVTGRMSLLAKFSPLLVDIARDSLTYSDARLRAAATLSLGKFMVVSEMFCSQKLPPIAHKKEEGNNLQLLFTILEKTKETHIKCNTIIQLSDLCGRFSNLLDPWTPRLFQFIQDKDVHVRKTTLLALSRLVVSDQLKPRKFGSQMARLIVDSDPMVVGHSKQVFKQLKSKDSGKSATIYNMIPDILANLCGHKSSNRLENEADVHIVMDFLFEMITRDVEKEGLVKTICLRIKDTTDEREVQDLTYCLTLMTYSQRSFKHLVEFTPTLATHLTCDTIFDHINKIVEQVKQNKNINQTVEFKDMVEQFENDVRKIREFKEHEPNATLDESEVEALGILPQTSPKINKRPPVGGRGSTTKKAKPGPSARPARENTKSKSKSNAAAASTRPRRGARYEEESEEEEDTEEEQGGDTEEEEEEEEKDFAAKPNLRRPGANRRAVRGDDVAKPRKTRKGFAFSDSESDTE